MNETSVRHKKAEQSLFPPHGMCGSESANDVDHLIFGAISSERDINPLSVPTHYPFNSHMIYQYFIPGTIQRKRQMRKFIFLGKFIPTEQTTN